MRANLTHLLLAVLLLAFASAPFGCAARRGDVVDKWETANQNLKIRVTQYQEKLWLPALPGYIYVFESASPGSDAWREIMTARTDDPVPIPKEQIGFVNDQTGYAFMSQTYVVTVDGGRTWSAWHANADAYIKDVRVGADGAGAMTFHPNPRNQQQALDLHTTDFGQHWRS
jgi:hypothetical protein